MKNKLNIPIIISSIRDIKIIPNSIDHFFYGFKAYYSRFSNNNMLIGIGLEIRKKL